MSRWKVLTRATVHRIYYVDARDEKRAEEVSMEITSQIETDICEETISITRHDNKGPATDGR